MIVEQQQATSLKHCSGQANTSRSSLCQCIVLPSIAPVGFFAAAFAKVPFAVTHPQGFIYSASTGLEQAAEGYLQEHFAHLS